MKLANSFKTAISLLAALVLLLPAFSNADQFKNQQIDGALILQSMDLFYFPGNCCILLSIFDIRPNVM